ncbi:MAG: hypothetical protein ABI036_18540 [Fibrobacteria bacterium]
MLVAAFRILIVLALVLPGSPASAAPRALDQARIHASYNNGDFDKVIKELEAYQKADRFSFPGERVFLEKYLAVVYAANPGTRELGRYHMYRLLDLAPEADLLDMFVGEEVDAVFDKVRKEHSLRSKAAAPKPPRKAAQPDAGKRAAAPAPMVSKASAAPAAWESAAFPNNASYANEATDAPARVSLPAGTAWDDLGSLNSGAPSALNASAAETFASAPATGAGSGAARSSGTPRHSGQASSAARPAWKEPALWLGSGAALAVVAFTLFQSGGSNTPEPKTYVVPATAAR